MDRQLTMFDLETRWDKALKATLKALVGHIRVYRELKTLAAKVVAESVDIDDYYPTVEKLVSLLTVLDPDSQDSIFHIYKARISPSSIWDVRTLRLECRDLLQGELSKAGIHHTLHIKQLFHDREEVTVCLITATPEPPA